ncbi:protein FAR1-RELATED SEQUENCE 12-like isoform X1 [Typha latifolia]|uniref:protein FAR1-RELATED SEQUENCE 12-like isoform X1 n=1 Tax=Typha latifolia TaxID=4733 RepID=UPI003C2DFC78
MVLIAEIRDDPSNVEGRPKEEGIDDETAKENDENNPSDNLEAPPVDPEAEVKENPPENSPAPAPAPASAPPVAITEASSAGPKLYSEYALRVAYIMRSYLSMRQAGSAGASGFAPVSLGEGEGLSGDRCKAMMEVVRKEHGRWAVSKLVMEHNHSLTPREEGGEALPLPVMGMEFESVEAAKAFYYGYGESFGFKARTGSNRRSAGSGALIMQRFLCWRGDYLMYRKNAEVSTMRRKRGPYKKRARRLAEEAAAAAKRVGTMMEVIQVAGSAEKGEVEVQSNAPVSNAMDAGLKMMVDAKVGGKGKDDGRAIPVANTAQSRLLRELGVRVSRYTNEERRNIILKYMMKRKSRPGAERPPKVPSRQALAERRQRGVGGRFLSREGTQVPSRKVLAERRQRVIVPRILSREETKALRKDVEMVEPEPEPDPPAEVVSDAGGEPKVGMVFPNEEKAYEFYVNYATTVGFSIRKGWWDKSARNITRSRVYVCSREGFRPKSVAIDSKKPRPETRTGCQARMAIKITSSGRYCISEFVPDHNHELVAPLDIQKLRSQKLLAKVQPARHNATLIPANYKNYLRSKRMKDMQLGDAGALCEYLQKMKSDNPSFFYAIQVDEDDQLTNIFWADAKSMMDFHYFGDVLCFDTRYRINDYGRPFALFVGINHHKQSVIFGAALIYDESVESFKWLFETFKSAMSGKQPKTVLIDQCTSISEAITVVWPGTIYRPCVLHVYQNATKILSHIFEGSETFAPDFSRCLYDCEEEEEFLSAWEMLLEKYDLKDNDWLRKLYAEREIWALVYGRHTFCADITSTLRSDNLNAVLKEYLKLEVDLPYFLKQYDKLVVGKRFAEQQADYLANQGTARIPPLRLLWQASSAYTPAVFEVFRLEYELLLSCMVYSCGEVGTISEYEVTVKDKPRVHFVRFDSSDCTVVCSCKMFDFVGVQCCHVLKVLDCRNIKELPQHYILKRWRKDAKSDTLRGNCCYTPDDDPKLSLSKRYSSLCRILYKVAAKAAENVEAYAFMESQSDQLLEQVERILQARLLEKSPSSAPAKGHQQTLVQNEGSNNEMRRVSGKKSKNGDVRRRQQNVVDTNKRRKGIQGMSDEAENALRSEESPATSNAFPANPRNPPNQFLATSQLMQAPYPTSQQFGLGSVQVFHGMTQLNQMQESSVASLQQQPFHSSTPMSQNTMQPYPPPDMQSLQFIGSNPQLGNQSADQGHYTIPVWDFL